MHITLNGEHFQNHVLYSRLHPLLSQIKTEIHPATWTAGYLALRLAQTGKGVPLPVTRALSGGSAGGSGLEQADLNNNREVLPSPPVKGYTSLLFQDDLGSSLYYAAYFGLFQAVQCLLDHGVDPNSHLGFPTEDLDASEDLCIYGNPLCVAAYQGETKICKLLLRRGASIDVEGLDKRTPIWFAARAGQTSTVHLLLKSGARIDAGAGTEEWTTLGVAALWGHLDTMRILVDYGADVNAITYAENTALTWAAQEGRCNMIRFLLDCGADVEHPNNRGETPLICAAMSGNVDCVTLLREQGANLAARTRATGSTSLHKAVQRGHYAVIEKLVHLHADIESPDHKVSKTGGHFRLPRSLYDKG